MPMHMHIPMTKHIPMTMHMPMHMPMPMPFRAKYSLQKNCQGKYSLHKNICFFSFLNTYKFFNMQRRHLKKKLFFS